MWLGNASHCKLRREHLLLVDKSTGKLGADDARTHSVDADVARGQFKRECLGYWHFIVFFPIPPYFDKSNQGRLRHGVYADQIHWLKARN